MEPIQSETRNNGHLQKRSKSDSIEKKVEHHSTSILVNTSDPESEVDIEDELKSKKVNDTFPDDSSNPVSSFAKICKVSFYDSFINFIAFIDQCPFKI